MARRGRKVAVVPSPEVRTAEKKILSRAEKLDLFKWGVITEFNRNSDKILEWRQEVGPSDGISVEYSIAWSSNVVESEFLTSKWFAILRAETDEEMVVVARHTVEWLTEDIMEDAFAARSTCLIVRAIGEYHRDAARRMVKTLKSMLREFDPKPVPMVELC